MKIMMAHNYYASTAPSGEEVVFRDELTLLRTFITSIPSYHLWPIGLVATRAWQWCRRCITFECFAPTECCWIDAECVSLVCTTSNLSAQWSKDVTAILESQACLWPSC